MTLASVVDLLACPHCAGALQLGDNRLCCPDRHSFDLARQGYVNLLGAPTAHRADTAAMVAARDRFLGAGWYATLADRVADRLATALAGTPSAPPARSQGGGAERDQTNPEATAVLESGAGTGYYLATALSRLGAERPVRGVALDLSVPACRRAARTDPRLGAVVADTWGRLPLRNGGFAAVLSVFAPRHPEEFARVLAPGGVVLVAAAGPDHLAEVRERLGLLGIEPDKTDRLRSSMDPWFTPLGEDGLRVRLDLDRDALTDLVAMGPNAFHGDPDRVHTGAEVTASVRLAWFRRRQPAAIGPA